MGARIFGLGVYENKLFTGRGETLSRISSAFSRANNNPNKVVVSGPSGIGKTQIALRYICQSLDKYNNIFYFRSPDCKGTLNFLAYDHIQKTFLQFMGKEHLIIEGGNEDVINIKINEFLQLHKKWLLVFDNINDYDTIIKFIPMSEGNVLILSQSPNGWENHVNENEHVKLTSFDDNEGAVLISKLLNQREVSSSMHHLSSHLFGFPRAIEEACIVINEGFGDVGERINNYIKLFKNNSNNALLVHESSLKHRFELIFKDMPAEELKLTQNFLYCISFFSERIGADICQYIIPDTHSCNVVIKNLSGRSLIAKEANAITFSGIFKKIIQDGIDENLINFYLESAINILSEVVKNNVNKSPYVSRSLLQHFESILSHEKFNDITPSKKVMLLKCYAHTLELLGHYISALEIYAKINDLTETDTQTYHVIFQSVANCHVRLQQWVKSDANFNKALGAVDGKNINAQASIYNDMGVASRYKLNNAEAMEQFGRGLGLALSVPENEQDKILLATLYNNIADIELQGAKVKDAFEKFTNSLQILKEANRVKSAKYGNILVNLGQIYLECMDPNTALKYFNMASDILDDVYRGDIVATRNLYIVQSLETNDINNIPYQEGYIFITGSSELYWLKPGRHLEKLPIINISKFKEMLNTMMPTEYKHLTASEIKDLILLNTRSSEKIRHPDIARVLSCLGNAYVNLKEYEKAKTFFEESLDCISEFYPNENMEVRRMVFDLSRVNYIIERPPGGSDSFLNIFKEIETGNSNKIFVLTMKEQLADTYSMTSEFLEAIPKYEEIFELVRYTMSLHTAKIILKLGDAHVAFAVTLINTQEKLENIRKALVYYETLMSAFKSEAENTKLFSDKIKYVSGRIESLQKFLNGETNLDTFTIENTSILNSHTGDNRMNNESTSSSFNSNQGISSSLVKVPNNDLKNQDGILVELIGRNPGKPLDIKTFYDESLSRSNNSDYALLQSIILQKSTSDITSIITSTKRLLSKHDNFENRPAHIAAIAKRTNILQLLEKEKQDIFNTPNKLGLFPLHFSILTYDKNSISYFLEELKFGARKYLTRRITITYMNKKGNHITVKPNFLDWTLMFGDEAALELLLDQIDLSDSPEDVIDGSGLGTLIHLVVRRNSIKLMYRLLEYPKLKDLINKKEDETGLTPFTLAVLLNHFDIAQLLLSRCGIEKDFVSTAHGWAALHWVIWKLNVEAVCFLMKNGVDIDLSTIGTGVDKFASYQPLALVQYRKNHINIKINQASIEQKRKEVLEDKLVDIDAIQTILKNRAIKNPNFRTVREFVSAEKRIYNNLVLNGGGAKGLLFPYAFKHLRNQLPDSFDLQYVHRIAGTSAGSIAMLFLGLGYDANGLQQALSTLDVDTVIFEKKKNNPIVINAPSSSNSLTLSGLIQGMRNILGKTYETLTNNMVTQLGSGIMNISLHNGALSGDTFLKWLEDSITERLKAQNVYIEKIRDGAITFKQWQELVNNNAGKGFKHLYITVTQLNPELKTEIMNTEFIDDWYADIPIADAIRASMSIPVVFKPYQMRKRDQHHQPVNWTRTEAFFVDGGLLCNYPLHEFDRAHYTETALRRSNQAFLSRQTCINHRTLGLYLIPSNDSKESLSAPNSIGQLASRLWDLYYDNEALANFRKEDDEPRTIYLACSEKLETGGKKITKEITTLDFKKIEIQEYKDFADKWSKAGVEDFIKRNNNRYEKSSAASQSSSKGAAYEKK